MRDWEKWQERCIKGTPFPRREAVQQVHPVRQMTVNIIKQHNCESVLDVGCGPALDYDYFKSTDISYTCCDLTPRFIEEARRRYPDIDARLADAANLPFDDRTYDCVYCKDLLEHMPPDIMKRSVDEMWRVARNLMIISWFIPPEDKEIIKRTHQGTGYYLNTYDKKQICDRLKKLPEFQNLRIVAKIGELNLVNKRQALYIVTKELPDAKD